MRWYKGPDGSDRLWISADEIEYSMEDELRNAGLFPSLKHPVVDVERFLERHLGVVLDQHADLDPEVLGMTEFSPQEKPRVSINRDLTDLLDDMTSLLGDVGRFRATLAHEGAHVILHRILFELDQSQGTLFAHPASETTEKPRLMRCLKRDFGVTGRGDWREVQANRGMAALLMPREVFLGCATLSCDAHITQMRWASGRWS